MDEGLCTLEVGGWYPAPLQPLSASLSLDPFSRAALLAKVDLQEAYPRKGTCSGYPEQMSITKYCVTAMRHMPDSGLGWGMELGQPAALAVNPIDHSWNQ